MIVVCQREQDVIRDIRVSFDTKPNKWYTIVLYDPKRLYVHWMITNVRRKGSLLVSPFIPLYDYDRYRLVLLEHKKRRTVETPHLPDRYHFSLVSFMRCYHLRKIEDCFICEV